MINATCSHPKENQIIKVLHALLCSETTIITCGDCGEQLSQPVEEYVNPLNLNIMTYLLIALAIHLIINMIILVRLQDDLDCGHLWPSIARYIVIFLIGWPIIGIVYLCGKMEDYR